MFVGISQCQWILFLYFEQLFGKLCRYEIVEFVCGLGGGYNFVCCVQDVIVVDIIIVVDELFDVMQCGGKGMCDGLKQFDGYCMMYELWLMLNQKMVEYFDLVLLQDFVDQQCVCEGVFVVLCDCCVFEFVVVLVEFVCMMLFGFNLVFNIVSL